MSQSGVATMGAPQVAASVYNLKYAGVGKVPIGEYWRLVLDRGRDVFSCASLAVGDEIDFSSNQTFETPVEAETGVRRTLAESSRHSSNVEPNLVAKPVMVLQERL